MQQDAYEQVGPTTNLLAVCEQLHVARTQESTDRSIQNALRGHVTHQCRQHNFCIPAGPLSRAHRPFSAFSPWAAMGPSVPHLSHNYQFLSQAQQPMFKEFQMGEAPYSSAMFSFAPMLLVAHSSHATPLTETRSLLPFMVSWLRSWNLGVQELHSLPMMPHPPLSDKNRDVVGGRQVEAGRVLCVGPNIPFFSVTASALESCTGSSSVQLSCCWKCLRYLVRVEHHVVRKGAAPMCSIANRCGVLSSLCQA